MNVRDDEGVRDDIECSQAKGHGVLAKIKENSVLATASPYVLRWQGRLCVAREVFTVVKQ